MTETDSNCESVLILYSKPIQVTCYTLIIFMNIGFDLDNIFINTPPFVPQSLIERLYRGKPGKTLSYKIPSKNEQIIRQLAHLPILRPPIKENLIFLRKLAQDSHKLYLVSSRFGFLRKHTENLVRNHQLDKLFHGLYFNFNNDQPHLFKNEHICKLKIDKYVDDDLHLLKYISGNNNHVKLYWLNNKNNNKISNNVTGITSLTEILED